MMFKGMKKVTAVMLAVLVILLTPIAALADNPLAMGDSCHLDRALGFHGIVAWFLCMIAANPHLDVVIL